MYVADGVIICDIKTNLNRLESTSNTTKQKDSVLLKRRLTYVLISEDVTSRDNTNYIKNTKENF